MNGLVDRWIHGARSLPFAFLLCCGLRRFLFITSFGVLLSGCTTSSSLYLRDELANRGPIALSSANPYISSNLFLGREMERSQVFRGFIEYRGTPDAVELKVEMLKPLKLSLYYLQEMELFSLEEGTDDWIVRGPDRIPQQFASAFINIPGAGRSAPLVLNGKVQTNILKSDGNIIQAPSVLPGESDPVVEEELAPPAPKREQPRKAPAAAPKAARPPVKPSVAAETPLPTTLPKAAPPKSPPSESEPAVRGDVSLVEESSSGDIIHRVTFPGETLAMITAWYTGDAANSERLARINGIELPSTLRVGQNVRIPRYLLKTAKPMPRSEIAR